MRLRSLVARRGVDVFIVALALAAEAEVWLDPAQAPREVTAPAALLWTLPLLLHRRFPLGAPAFVFAVLCAEALVTSAPVTSSQVNALVILGGFGIVGAHPRLRPALAGAGLGYAAIAIIASADRPPLGAVVSIALFAAFTWLIGRSLGERGRRARALEAHAARLERGHGEAVAAERERIARELHDVIAHSVTVMTVQAGAARVLLDEDPVRAREPLLAVEQTGRQALAEMRRLLGILRGAEESAGLAPQPGLAHVESLADQVRAAGLPVDVAVEGEARGLSPGVDVAAYRVVQEALTNALRHAGAARAEVAIRYGPGSLELTVVNDGRVAANGGPGHGLVGMRERVALYGGELEAGPRPGGGFSVHATLPLGEDGR